MAEELEPLQIRVFLERRVHTPQERVRGEEQEGATAGSEEEPAALAQHPLCEPVRVRPGIGHPFRKIEERLLLEVVGRAQDRLGGRRDSQATAEVGERSPGRQRGRGQHHPARVLEQARPEDVRHLDRRDAQGGPLLARRALHPIDGVRHALLQELRDSLAQVTGPGPERGQGHRLVRIRRALLLLQRLLQLRERGAQPIGHGARGAHPGHRAVAGRRFGGRAGGVPVRGQSDGAHLREELPGGLFEAREDRGHRAAPALAVTPGTTPPLPVSEIVQEAPDRTVRDAEPELSRDRLLDPVRLVQDDDRVRRQDPPSRFEIEEEQRVIHDQQIRIARAGQVPAVQAAFPVRPARALADLAVAADPRPDRVRHVERDLRAQSRGGAPGMPGESFENLRRARFGQVAAGQRRFPQALHAQVVLRSHQQGVAEGDAGGLQGPLQERQVRARQLLLQGARVGRDDDAPLLLRQGPVAGGVEDGRDEVGQRLADAGAGLDQEMPARGERGGHVPCHARLLRARLERGQRPGQGPVRGEHSGHLGDHRRILHAGRCPG